MAIALSETKTQRLILIFGIYALASLWGINSAFIENSAAGFAFTLGEGLLTSMFCALDAGQRGRPLPRSCLILFLLLWGLLAPCYLLWSRGWRGLHWSLLALAGFLFALYGSFFAVHAALLLLQMARGG